MSTGYDIAIVGGGPAGTAAAITAARSGNKVLLLDRDTFPRPKVCGEFVSAESLALLASLLGTEHPLLTKTVPIRAGRLFLRGGVTDTHIEPAARSIPRYDLDHALWRAAESAGVFTHAGEGVELIRGDGPFTLVTTKDAYAAKSIIHASGRWSGLLHPLKPPTGPKWIGIKAHYETPDAAPSVDLYFFRHGYCGVQPVSANVVNICAMVRADVASSMEEVLECHPALKMRGFAMRRMTAPVVTAPLLHERPTPVSGHVLHAGDAAGFLDPFLGDGISLAMQTGARAAKALSTCTQGSASLADAVAAYGEDYRLHIQPAFHHAARLRRLVSISQPFQPAVSGLLKIPHITEWFLRNTRPKVALTD